MKNLYSIKVIFSLIILLLLSSELLATGALFVRPRGSSQTYQKMWIKNINVDVDIQDQVATTKVDQTFMNTMNSSVESIFMFPLPENAVITELVYWFNGQRYVAEIREREEAVKEYNEKLKDWLDPALLEDMGNNLFRLSIVPINANSEVRTEITYVEMIDYEFGVNKYRYMLNTYDLSSQPVETVYLRVNAKSQNLIKFFSSPSHGAEQSTTIMRHSSFHHSLVFGDENYIPDSDLIIHYETIRNDVQYSMLTYTPTPEDSMGTDSFYTLWITPPDSVSDEDVIPKNIVFTADISSSMEGERIRQIKEALQNFIDLLNDEDKFNIITFGTNVVPFATNLVEVNDSTIEEAQDFVSKIYALGMTNISAALDSSLSQSFGDSTSNSIVFFTDGRPTIGTTLPDDIVEMVDQNNIKDVNLFTYGVGDDVNKSLLTLLARENSGYVTFIEQDENISTLITNHFNRISKPILNNISLDMGGLHTWDTYPKTMGDIYWGSQTNEVGLYSGKGDYNVKLTADVAGEPVEFNKTMTFPDSGGHRFVARLWGRAKINHLLELIDIYGETDELVEQIKTLSLRFQILTKYTAFYSDPTDITDEEPGIPDQFEVYQNYPNPFNPTTVISYKLPVNSFIQIKIYDILGKEVRTLFSGEQTAGKYEIMWDGKDNFHRQLSSGIYFYTVTMGKQSITKKMLLLR